MKCEGSSTPATVTSNSGSSPKAPWPPWSQPCPNPYGVRSAPGSEPSGPE